MMDILHRFVEGLATMVARGIGVQLRTQATDRVEGWTRGCQIVPPYVGQRVQVRTDLSSAVDAVLAYDYVNDLGSRLSAAQLSQQVREQTVTFLCNAEPPHTTRCIVGIVNSNPTAPPSIQKPALRSKKSQ